MLQTIQDLKKKRREIRRGQIFSIENLFGIAIIQK